MQTAKQRINQLLLLITTCFFIGISFSSCEKELYEDGIKNSSKNITVAHVSLSSLDITTSSKITEKITELKSLSKKTNAQGKFEYNSELDIYVDTENGRLVNNNGKLFYTFPMFRESEVKLENIVFALLSNGEMETYFARYNVTPEVFIDLSFENIQYLNPEIQKVSFNGPVWICIENQTWQQVSNEGISASGLQPLYTYEWVTTSFTCQIVSGGGNDGDDNSNNNNTNPSTGESGGGNAGSVSTSPVGLTLGQKACKNYIKNLTTNPILGSCYAASSPEFKNNLASSFGALDINDETVTEASIKAFADQAIMAVCNGAQVDFPNRIILDPTFLNSIKIKCVYDKMISGANNNFFKKMLQRFNNNTNKTLTFKVGNLPQPNPGRHDWAITDGNPNNSNVFSITTDTELENQSILQIMNTLCHELIHAYMFDSLQDYGYLSFDQNGNLQFNIASLNCNYNTSTNFATLSNQQSFEAILCALNNNNIPTDYWAHDLFNAINFDINVYRENLEQFLYENYNWDNENLIFEDQMISIFGNNWKHEVARALSWMGLESTLDYPNYINSFPANSPEKDFAQNPMLLLSLANHNCP